MLSAAIHSLCKSSQLYNNPQIKQQRTSQNHQSQYDYPKTKQEKESLH